MFSRSLLAWVVACGVISDSCFGQELPQRERGNLAIQARAILRKYCIECHGPNHASDPARTCFSVLNYPQIVNPDLSRDGYVLIDRTGKSRSSLLELIECGSMPPGGRKRPSEMEVNVLKMWAAAKAPSYPRAFDDDSTLSVMLDDLSTRPADERPFLRYISFANLILEDQPVPDLNAAEAELFRTLPPVTYNPERYSPEPVDDSATLYRLDIRKFGWSERDLFVCEEPNQGNAFTLTPYDFILLEYPYAFTLPPNHPESQRLREYFSTIKSIRPVPFLRSDWLTSILQQDEPISNELSSLMELAEDLRKKTPKIRPGPRDVTPFKNAKPVMLPRMIDTRLTLAPICSVTATDVATNPPPVQFKASIVQVQGEPLTRIKLDEAFRIEVESDRQVSLTLLNVMPNGEYRIMPFRDGNILAAGKLRLLQPENAGGFTIPSIEGGKNEAVEHFIVYASEEPIPRDAMTIVRSRHPDYNATNNRGPIWRVVFHPQGGKLDETKIVRKVLPLTVTRK